MRKIRHCILVVAVIILILGCSPVSAQDGFQFGISTGVQNTLLYSVYRSEIDVKNAFCPLATADIEYRFSPLFGIQSGIGYALYSQNTSKFRNNFSYLTTPIYFKFGGFRNKRKLALSLFGGPNFKYLISASNVTQNEKNDISEYTTRFHIDYTLGIGLKHQLNENLVIESHIMGSFLGGSFNKATTDFFILKNTNYGAILGFRYHFKGR